MGLEVIGAGYLRNAQRRKVSNRVGCKTPEFSRGPYGGNSSCAAPYLRRKPQVSSFVVREQ